MLTSHIDLGQIIIAGLIAVVGYFVKRTVERVEKRLDKHDDMFMSVFVALGIRQEASSKAIERRLRPR